MKTQTSEEHNNQPSRDQEKDSVHDPLFRGKAERLPKIPRLREIPLTSKRELRTGQNTETRCDKQKDSEHHALQTESSTTDGDVKTEKHSSDIKAQASKEQNTRAKSDQEKDALLHTLQSESSTTNGDAKTDKNSFDIKTKTSKGQNTQTRRDQDKDYVRPAQFQTDETQPERLEFVTSSHEKQETEEHINTSDDYVQLPGKSC